MHNRNVIIILSSDTEFDPPSHNDSWTNRRTKALLDGLPRFLELCDSYDAPATFFCEGRLVEEQPDLFRELTNKHEIGCHSYNHEWLGTRRPPRWIPLKEQLSVLPPAGKEAIIRRAAESIEGAIGMRPRSFKAPFNSVDHPSTLSLLDRVGFDSDSSLPCYNTASFTHPLHPTPCRRASAVDLWAAGDLNLIEVPFMIRPRPLFFHPFDIREEVIDTVSRSMKLALESVDVQCRIDSLSGRDFTFVQVTSHPWEFSEMGPWGGEGKANIDRLQRYLDELSRTYEVEFLTVTEFIGRWRHL